MTKAEAYRKAETQGLGFVANVIATRHRNSARKLKGLVQLAEQGHEIRTAQFDCDTLVIDGRVYGWDVLESPRLVDQWRGVAAIAFDDHTKRETFGMSGDVLDEAIRIARKNMSDDSGHITLPGLLPFGMVVGIVWVVIHLAQSGLLNFVVGR